MTHAEREELQFDLEACCLPLSACLSEHLIGQSSQLIRVRSGAKLQPIMPKERWRHLLPCSLMFFPPMSSYSCKTRRHRALFSVKLGNDRSEQQRKWLCAFCVSFSSHTICFLKWDTYGSELQTVCLEGNVI